MNLSLTTRVAGAGLEAVGRLRDAWWPITQASVAAGLAWYLTHGVLAHPLPFFAPIAAAVCLSASNVLRGQRAVQMIIGVALGIGLGAGVQMLFGTDSIAIGIAVLVALGVAVLVGHGFFAQGVMFFNQTAISAILVLTFGGSGLVLERLFDALIGGGLALVFSMLLFPANPVVLVRDARAGVLSALHDILTETADMIGDRAPVAGWPLSAVDRLNDDVAALNQARSTAHQLVLAAPRRWAARDSVRDADRQAAQLGVLASTVLHLARVVVPTLDTVGPGDRLPQPLSDAIRSLATGTAAADADPAGASAHAAAARRQVSGLQSAAGDRTVPVLAAIVESCVDDLQGVIDPAAR